MGGSTAIEDWLEQMAEGEEWASKLCEAINVQAVKDYRHYRWMQRTLYADHIKAAEKRKATIAKAEKELMGNIREYHKRCVIAERTFKKEDKKYNKASVEVNELRRYFKDDPWGDINGEWVMQQIDDQIEMALERMNRV